MKSNEEAGDLVGALDPDGEDFLDWMLRYELVEPDLEAAHGDVNHATAVSVVDLNPVADRHLVERLIGGA